MPLLKLKLHHLPKLKRKLTQMLNLLRKVNRRRKLNRRLKARLNPLQKPSLHRKLSLALNPALKQRESSLKLTKLQQLCKEEQLHLLAKLPVAAVVGVEAAEAAKVVPAVAADKSPWDNTTRWQ